MVLSAYAFAPDARYNESVEWVGLVLRRLPLRRRHPLLEDPLMYGLKTSKEQAAMLLRRAEEDPTAPLEIRPSGRERFGGPILEVGLATLLTVIYCANGAFARALAGHCDQNTLLQTLLLPPIVGAAFAHLRYVQGYSVAVDTDGIVVFNGFWHRKMRWQEVAGCEWKTKVRTDEDGKDQIARALLLRDAAGRVRLRIDVNLLALHQPLLTRLINFPPRSTSGLAAGQGAVDK